MNLFELERLRLGERGVMRAGFANVGLRPLVVVFELADFLLQGGSLFGFVGLRQALRLVVELSAQAALAFEQRGVHALAHIGAGFGEQVEEAAGALAFADLNGEGIQPFRWLSLVLTHQQVGVKLVSALDGGEKRGAGFRADKIRAH